METPIFMEHRWWCRFGHIYWNISAILEFFFFNKDNYKQITKANHLLTGRSSTTAVVDFLFLGEFFATL